MFLAFALTYTVAWSKFHPNILKNHFLSLIFYQKDPPVARVSSIKKTYEGFYRMSKMDWVHSKGLYLYCGFVFGVMYIFCKMLETYVQCKYILISEIKISPFQKASMIEALELPQILPMSIKKISRTKNYFKNQNVLMSPVSSIKMTRKIPDTK